VGLLPAELRGRVCLFLFFLSVTLLLGQLYTATSRVNIDHARHRKPRRCVYALKLRERALAPRTKVPPGKRPTQTSQMTPEEKVRSSDIFYCSGSRQLNHSSFLFYWPDFQLVFQDRPVARSNFLELLRLVRSCQMASIDVIN